MIEIDPELHLRVLPLAWLLGRWEGAGVGRDHAGAEYRFGQELVVGHDGRAFLSYDSASWVLDDEGRATAPGPRETGYVRPVAAARVGAPRAGGDGSVSGPEELHDTELLLAHSDGIVELYVGARDGARLELATDAVVRTVDAPGRAAAKRLYGLVEGDLLWAWDSGEAGELDSTMSARLRKVGAAPGAAVPPGLLVVRPEGPGPTAT